ncbi:hypothetical protein CEXT_671 [Caerostris extrusa]|uniref:Uncharacterized protein n=1 Tax=Caerostris extrusa TaxID=172846 RepID=A0AAV4RVS8_CAEEX|nr:hypothetical protein CEXT_671 [Caerostris extrusa]
MVRFNDGLKEHVAAISNQHKEDVRVKLAGEQLKIFPVNSDVHRAVTRYLTEKSWNFLLLHRKSTPAESGAQRTAVEEEKSPTFTREQIEALLFEIEEEQKGVDEEEIDPLKLEAIDVYTSCKKFLNSVAGFHNKNIQTLQFESEKLDAVPRKKLKKRDKVKKASSVTDNFLSNSSSFVNYFVNLTWNCTKSFEMHS